MNTTKFLRNARCTVAATVLAVSFVSSCFAGVKEKIVHNFSDKNYFSPLSGVTFDSKGNLYGTIADEWGGAVYELIPTAKGAKYVELHRFCPYQGCTGGGAPDPGLILDEQGNLYGATIEGGTGYGCGYGGCGVVFELTPQSDGTWAETVLYNFTGFADGGGPYGGVVFDSAGNLYGATGVGAGCDLCGVVFELSPASDGTWTETTLYTFTDGSDGGFPTAKMSIDSSGNLFGTAAQGGIVNQSCPEGCGVVFELTTNGSGVWTQKVLYAFQGGADGIRPIGMTLDGLGNIYGTTTSGGVNNFGVIFKLAPGSPNWSENVLYTFSGGADGKEPSSTVTLDSNGNLYGTTYNGGLFGNGVIYECTPTGSGVCTEQSWSFNGSNGSNPEGGITFNSTGNAYGTTSAGGTKNQGVVFQIGK